MGLHGMLQAQLYFFIYINETSEHMISTCIYASLLMTKHKERYVLRKLERGLSATGL
jgi:hypothetical protein